MRKNCHKHYSWGYLGKSLIAVLVIIFGLNLSAISQSSTLTDDGELLSLYRELKLVESESLRVAVTIDALEQELHEYHNPDSIERLHSRLGDLYKYDVQLASHYIYLDEVWSYLQHSDRKPAVTKFSVGQTKPIPKIHKGVYERLPEGAIPITDFPPITIEHGSDKLTHPDYKNPSPDFKQPPSPIL